MASQQGCDLHAKSFIHQSPGPPTSKLYFIFHTISHTATHSVTLHNFFRNVSRPHFHRRMPLQSACPPFIVSSTYPRSRSLPRFSSPLHNPANIRVSKKRGAFPHLPYCMSRHLNEIHDIYLSPPISARNPLLGSGGPQGREETNRPRPNQSLCSAV